MLEGRKSRSTQRCRARQCGGVVCLEATDARKIREARMPAGSQRAIGASRPHQAERRRLPQHTHDNRRLGIDSSLNTITRKQNPLKTEPHAAA